MSDNQQRIPSFDEVMKESATPRGVPSFEDIMGEEPVKKKETPTPSQVVSPASKIGGIVGSSAPLFAEEKKKISDYLQGLKTPEQKELAKPQASKSVQISTKPYKKEEGLPTQKRSGASILERVSLGENSADPLKGIAQEYTNDPVGAMEARSLLLNDIAANPYVAAKVLENTEFSLADNTNETANYLREKANEFKSVAEPLSVIQKDWNDNGQRDDNYYKEVYGLQLDNAAIKAFANLNPQFKKQLESAGINLNDTDLAGKITSGKRGQILDWFYSRPDLQEFVIEQMPYLKNAILAKQRSLLTDNTDYGINVVANEVSRARQEEGVNNIEPIFNFYGETNKETTNLIAQSLYKDDPVKMKIYNDYIRDNQEKYIDAPSLFEGIAGGMKSITGGIGETFSKPFQSIPERIREGWEVEASNVSADPQGFLKFLRESGHALGVVAAIGATGNVLGGGGAGFYSTKVVPALSGALPFFGDMLQQGTMKYPNSPVKAYTSALFNTALYAALGYQIFPSKSVQQAFTNVKPEVEQVVKQLTSGAISKEMARREMNTIANKALTLLSGTSLKTTKIAAELTGITAMNNLLDKAMGLSKEAQQQYNADEIETFKAMWLSNILVAGFAKYGEQKRENRLAEAAYYQAASKPKFYARIIDGLDIKDPSINKEELYNNLDFLVKTKDKLDQQGIDPRNQARFLFEALKEKVTQERIANQPESAFTRRAQEEIRGAQEVQENILRGEDVVKKEDEERRLYVSKAPEIQGEPEQISKPIELSTKEGETFAWTNLPLEEKRRLAVENLPEAKPEMTDKELVDLADANAKKLLAKLRGEKEAAPESVQIDQQRELETGTPDAELLTALQELSGEGIKDQDLQFFVDQASNAPGQFVDTYGPELTKELLAKATTEQLQKSLEDARKLGVQGTELLETELAKRQPEQPTQTGIEQPVPTEVIPEQGQAKPQEVAPEPGEKPIEAKVKAKELAEKVRKLKIDLSKLSGGGMQSNVLGLPVAVWNGAMDIVAKTIEAGGEAVDAIKRGLNYIQKNHRGQWEKKRFNDEVMKELGVRGITVNGEDMLVKDVDREFAPTINGFYSDIEQSVLDVKKGTVTAKEWLDVIGKGDEAKYTGVRDWLESLPKNQTVSRQEVLDWMKDNRIQIVEVVKSEDSLKERVKPIQEELIGVNNKIREYRNRLSELTPEEKIELATLSVKRQELSDKLDQEQSRTIQTGQRYTQYQLPGEKENYKEVLVTLPNEKVYESESYQVVNPKTNELISEYYGRFAAEKVAQRVGGVVVKKTVTKSDKLIQFKSTHFDEPNILVHLRMNTRTDAEGKKVLFLEEVQSDWGKRGREEGFNLSKNEVESKYNEADKNLSNIEKRLSDKYGSQWDMSGDIEDKLTPSEFLDYKNAVTERAKWGNRLGNEFNTLTPKAPFVTETSSWVKLALKVAAKEAVKQGADRIAWTTGEQQNERYDLSKQVDQITYDKKGDVYRVTVWKNGAAELNADWKENELENNVGKDVAAKMINGEGELMNNGIKSLSGIDLKVGGKGMKGFYGEPSEGKLGIVGEVAKGLFKQEIGKTEIDISGKDYETYPGRDEIDQFTDWLNERYGENSHTTVDAERMRDRNSASYIDFKTEKRGEEKKTINPSIEITPELKAEVEGGLPMFKDIKGRGKEIADLLRKGKIKSPGLQSNIFGIPVAIWNAAVETIATLVEGGATLAQAVQKAISKHKLENIKDFSRDKFIAGLEKATGEKLIEEMPPVSGQPPVEPPKIGPEKPLSEGEKSSRNKSVLNRLYEAENVPESVKQKFRENGLEYKPKSQMEAAEAAKGIVDALGVDDAVALANSGGGLEGDVKTMVFGEALTRLQGEENAAKWAEVAIMFDNQKRSEGRGIAAIDYFYKNNPFGVVLKENYDRQQEFNRKFKGKEQSWKEFFEQAKSDLEFVGALNELVGEKVKAERAEARKTRKAKVHKAIDDTMAKWAKKVSIKNKDDVKKQGIGDAEAIFKAAGTAMKAAYDAGEAVAKVVQDAIDYISDKLGTKDWDYEEFRKEWNERFAEKTGKTLTDEEIKLKTLDKFRNKLKGLSDKEKDRVVRKMFEKVVDAGALEYDDLRKIIAETLGYGEMTKEEAARLRELTEKRNAVGEAAKRAQEERTNEAIENYYKTEIEAGKAARELQELLWNKPDILKRITSIMQLSTLGIPSLVNNPVYNFFNQLGVRFPVALVNSTLDLAGSAIAKMMGKSFEREYNIFETQKEFFQKLGLGSKEAFIQMFTGLNRQDYIQKEYYGQQIRPLRAIRDIIAYKQGKKALTKRQLIDKALQASVGIPAEAVARVLNLGDKPMRFAAEGAASAAFAKALGLKDIDYKLFIEFPKEEAYMAYKAKGFSDEQAQQKADYIEQAIVKEGQRSTFQQDNLVNDIISGGFGRLGGKESGAATLAKSLVISPYIKIPTNAFWSYYNLLNPEIAILQSLYHAGRSVKEGNRGETVNARLQMREARYWFAHAITGMGARAVIIMLVKAGIFVPGNTEEETKKERDAEQLFDFPGSLNISKLAALLSGKDPSKVKGGLVISNRWFGQFGTLGNSISRKWEDATPEQRKNQEEFWSVIFGGMELEGLKEIQNGLFGNTAAILDVINKRDASYWGINTLNMFANIIQPASVAQINRAQLDEVPKPTRDNFIEKLNQSFAQRSNLYRKALGIQIDKKRSMWGEPIPRGGNWLSRLFGISNIDTKRDGRPMYEDYLRTGDTNFLPPAVFQNLNGKKLNTQQYNKLQEYIGQSRKMVSLPYINDEAYIEGFDKLYSELDDDAKKKVLSYLYQLGRKMGLEKFYMDYPELRPSEEKTEDEEAFDEAFSEFKKEVKSKNE